MTDNDPLDSGWDTLAEEFGLEEQAPKTAPAPKAEAGPKPLKKTAAKPAVEFDEGDDTFGAGIDESPAPRASAALFDPGPDHIEHDLEEADDTIGEAAEELPDPEDEGEVGEAGEGSEATEEGGQKKKRRRRRRRKKGGSSSDPAVEGKKADEAEEVEEGEVAADVDSDEEEEPTSALDEELIEEGPRPEWKVMTWNELVGKLYRPS